MDNPKLKKNANKEYLKAEDVLKTLKLEKYYDSLKDYLPNQHYKYNANRSGFPSTPAQALYFVKYVDFYYRYLNSMDVMKIEALLNKYQMCGEYKFTKSKKWCRIMNNSEVIDALEKEFFPAKRRQQTILDIINS